ncbi:MAG: recombinase family protein [Planctomycetes bacterium]|nr:recombinase family protein [Planctomycetota bacterium]
MGKQAIAYLRKSTNKQEQSFDNQRRIIEDRAREDGYIIIEWFEDAGVSGSDYDRPGLRRMVGFCNENHDFDRVYIQSTDRLARETDDPKRLYALLNEIESTGKEIVDVENAAIKTGDPYFDIMIHTLKARQDGEYLTTLSQKTAGGQITTALRGYSNGQTTPYGCSKAVIDAAGKIIAIVKRGEKTRKTSSDKILIVPGDPFEMSVVRRIYRTYIDSDLGFRSIANLLNCEKIAAPNGGTWSDGTVRSILTNHWYAGILVWNKRTLGKFHRISEGKTVKKPVKMRDKAVENDPHDYIVVEDIYEKLGLDIESVIEKALFFEAQRKMSEKNTGQKNSNIDRDSRYLLTGLLYCGNCGSKMYGNSIKRKKKNSSGFYVWPKYICGGYQVKGTTVCTHNSVPAEIVEQLVIEKIREHYVMKVSRSEVERMIRNRLEVRLCEGDDSRREIEALKKQKVEVEKEISDTFAYVARNPDFEDIATTRLKELRKNLRQAESQIEFLKSRSFETKSAEKDIARLLARYDDLETTLDGADRGMLKSLLQKVVKRIVFTFRTGQDPDGGKNKIVLNFMKSALECAKETKRDSRARFGKAGAQISAARSRNGCRFKPERTSVTFMNLLEALAMLSDPVSEHFVNCPWQFIGATGFEPATS